MSTWKCFSILLFTLVCSGCKLVIVVPEGGSVATVSSKYSCAAGSTCIVDVTDFLFNELFYTRRDPGIRFVGWKARNRGLCGGSQLPCALTTVPLIGVAAVSSILDSDARFFLEPVFEPFSEVGGTGAGNFSQCRNPELNVEGTVWTFAERTTDLENGGVLEVFNEHEAGGTADFQGQPRRFNRQRFALLGDPLPLPEDSEFIGYYEVNESLPGGRGYGNESERNIPGLGRQRTVVIFDPYFQRDFSLRPGDVLTQMYRVETHSSIDAGDVSSSASSVVHTEEFLGIESITVPAGTFDACKTIVRTQQTPEMSDSVFENFSINWTGVGNGISLRREGATRLTELLSATINREAIK